MECRRLRDMKPRKRPPIRELPRGLRYVVVYVDLDGRFPPRKNSQKDILLLRAANLWLRRKEKGASDAFLFVSVGSSTDGGDVDYGFPDSSVCTVLLEPKRGRSDVQKSIDGLGSLFAGDELEIEPECGEYLEAAQEAAGTAVREWLTKEHPGAIAYPAAEYDVGGFWWVGVERSEDVGDWTIRPENFAPLLPEAHIERAATWLSILWPVIEEHGVTRVYPESLAQEYSAAWVAALAEWLQGFEGASGNFYNDFDADAAVRALGLSSFFLGFEAARLSGEDLETFCGRWNEELEELPSRALGLIVEDSRSELRDCLSSFFGDDVALFFALHSAIWPRYGVPMGEAIDALTGADDYESLAEIDAPWSFVTNGWCDEADQ